MEDVEVKEAEFETQALTLKEKANGLAVIDQATFALAGDEIKLLKENAGKITDFFKPLKEAAHKAHKAITEKEGSVLAPIKEADKIIREKMNYYLTEQERLRRMEEDRLRKIAEEEARKERERLLAQAVKAEEKGNAEKAEALVQKAEDVYVEPVTVAPTVQATKTETSAVNMVKELTIEVIDLGAFLGGLVAKGSAPTMLEVSPMKLKAWVKSNALTQFPGLSIKETMSARIR